MFLLPARSFPSEVPSQSPSARPIPLKLPNSHRISRLVVTLRRALHLPEWESDGCRFPANNSENSGAGVALPEGRSGHPAGWPRGARIRAMQRMQSASIDKICHRISIRDLE